MIDRFLIRRLSGLALVALCSAVVTPAETIFDMIPSPYPGSFPSIGFQATSADEFGDHIEFAGVDRNLDTVVVSLTNWSCENDFDLVNGVWVPNRPSDGACMTTPGSGFMHPITLNIYDVVDNAGNPGVGPLIATKTGNYFIPFRPSWDPQCTDPVADDPFGGTWFDPVLGACVHGYAFNIVFDFSADGIVLPDEVIYGVAYNTQTHGANPIGAAGPYNSLNFSVDTQSPSIGTDVEPGTVFWDTSFAGFYCDGGADGTDTFRRDAGCWFDGAGNPYGGVVRFNTPAIGACCTDGPGTDSECLETTQSECEAGGGLYLGDGSACADVTDCVPLLVELESFTADRTPEGGVAIRWTTSSEVDTQGFQVLRGDGGREKRARTLVGSFVPSMSNGIGGASYEVLDPQRVGPGTLYWLREVDAYGRTTEYGPIEIRPTPGRRTAPR